LKAKYDELLSTVAFNFNLRRYNKDKTYKTAADIAAAFQVGPGLGFTLNPKP